MSKKKAILMISGALFIGANLFLIFKDNSKAERSSYITEWTPAKKENITSKLTTSGVVTPLEVHHIYYDESSGAFKNFLVSKGDKVSSGTPLYEFSSDNKDADKQKLEIEKKQLAREAKLIDEQIKQLTYLQTVADSSSTTIEQESGHVSASTSDLVSLSIEKEIYDMELEKSRIEDEIDKYDELIDSDSDSDLGTTSDVDGTVKNIDINLKNPIVTIISDTPKVDGTFTEEELKKVQTGMKVKIASNQSKKAISGTLTKIVPFPDTDPSVKKKSSFPFEIELEGDNITLIQGTHVDVTVITKEAKNVITIPISTLEKNPKYSFTYILNDAGKIEKRKLSLGDNAEGRLHIKDGIEEDELVVAEPMAVMKSEATFITPLKTSKLEKKWFKAERKMTILKYIGAAFSKR
jgi:HlyD family secretion protein